MSLIAEIHKICLEVFRVYNRVIRTPANWQQERARLQKNPNSRAKWNYETPDLTGLSSTLDRLEKALDSKTHTSSSSSSSDWSIYSRYEADVVKSSVRCAKTKLSILRDLQKGTFTSTRTLRKEFYDIDYDTDHVVELFERLVRSKKIRGIREVGAEFTSADYSAQETAKLLEKYIEDCRNTIANVVMLPAKIKDAVVKAFRADVSIVDDPSFHMRCTTDPTTKVTTIFLNKSKRYSKVLTKIGVLHEFCGHALEMALFDNTLISQGKISEVYGYAGVSSPNIFDVKAEVFADKIVYPFLLDTEMKHMDFRRNVWLLGRAMADYIYHMKGGTIADVTDVFENLGLSSFAFDEAVMASIFVDGYQGMYLPANEYIENIQKQKKWDNRTFLTVILFAGKIPVRKIGSLSIDSFFQ